MISAIQSSIASKYRKGNQLLFSRDSECCQPLIRLIEQQKHRTLVMWALDCARTPLAFFESVYPTEKRPRSALELCEAWSKGQLKMPEAKRAILGAHAVAKEMDEQVYRSIAHAIGHAGATVHVETHALGLVFYELTSIVYRITLDACDAPVRQRLDEYSERLRYWQEHINTLDRPWAKFLLDDTRPNKEKLLNEKRRLKFPIIEMKNLD